MNERKRYRDGAGWGPDSWVKHELIKRVMGGQTAVLRRSFGDNGIIIDMHAGTGNGVEIAQGQLDLLRDNVSDATAALTCRFAREGIRPAKAILCESIFERREQLRTLFDNQAEILATNALLLRRSFSEYAWALVINDPNGPAHHALEVMQHIAAEVKASDFIINVNESALGRLAGVRPDMTDTGDNAALIQGCRKRAPEFAWMLDAEEWRVRLRKKHAIRARKTVNHRAMRGRVMLVSNFITDGVSHTLFERGSA